MFQQFSQTNPQVFFIIKERQQPQQQQAQHQQPQQQQYQQQQAQHQQQQQQQAYQQQQYQQQQAYQQQQQQGRQNYQQSPTGSPHGSTHAENSENLKQQLKTVTEELKKMETQKGLIEQKTIQLQAEMQAIDKKLIQVQAFASNFAPGTSNNLMRQKQQYNAALQQVSQTALVLNEKLQKYQQFTEVLENRIFQASQQEKEVEKAKALQQASSLSFQPNLEYEQQLVAADYVVTQIDNLLRQTGIQGNFSLAEKIICLLQSSCPLDKSSRLLLHLATNPNNREKLPETRILPVILNLLQSDSVDAPLRKSLLTLLSNLPSSESSKHAMAAAGVIPIAVTYLDSDDAQLVDLALTILSCVLIEDVYSAIFQYHGGVTKLISFFSQGTSQQQTRALQILSQTGFSEENDAVSFVSGSGNISAICDLIDSAEKEELREMAVRIVISLTKLAPVPMIESGSVGRVIGLIDCKSENIPLLKLSLQSIEPLLINSYVKQTVCNQILGDLVTLLDSPDEEIVSSTLTVLSNVFDDSTADSFEQLDGVQKVVAIFCNPSTKQAEIESSLKLLSTTGFSSSQNQLEFATQGGIEISLTFLMTEDKQLALNALSVLSYLSEHNSAIVNNIKRANLILSHLRSQLEDVDFIHDFLSSLNRFCSSDHSSVAGLFVQAGAFEPLIHLLNHFNEQIVLQSLTIIQLLCLVPGNQDTFVQGIGIPNVIKLLLSPKEEIRRAVLEFVSVLAPVSNDFRIAFGKHQLVKALTQIIDKEKAVTMFQVIRSVATDYQIQCQTLQFKFLDQLLRHLRSKDLPLVLQLVEVLCLLSTNNLLVVEALIAKDALVHIVRLVETLMLRVKLQITDRLLAMINQVLQLIINLSVSTTARDYLTEKTVMKITLKKLQALPDPYMKRNASIILAFMAFPTSPKPIQSSFSPTIVQVLDEIQICSIPEQWSELLVPASRETIIDTVSAEIKTREKNRDQNTAKLTPEQQEQSELARKIAQAEEDLQQAEARCERNKVETANIEESIKTLQHDIETLEEMNDEVLLPEIECKKKELDDLRKLLQDSNSISKLSLDELQDARRKYEASSVDKERLQTLTASFAQLSVDTAEKDQMKLRLIAEMYSFVQMFVGHMQRFQQGYLGSIQCLLSNKSINCSSDDAFAIKQLTADVQDVSRMCLLLQDKLAKNLRSASAEILIGKDLQCFTEFFQPIILFSKHYDPLVRAITHLMNKQQLSEVLTPTQSYLNLPNFAVFPMLVMRLGYYLSFFTNSLMKVTEVTQSDYRSLTSAQRKFQSLLTSIERKNQQEAKKTVPLKDERYHKLVALLNESDFMFLDIFGELKASESIVHQCVRLFAAQGMISSFLEHQISKEVAETVGESTLFRGKTFPTQCLSAFSHIVDHEYLLNTLAIYLRRLHGSEQSLEVNPRLIGSDVSEKDPRVKKNQETLRKECELAFSYINGTANQCTTSLKNVCYSLRTLIAKRFPGNEITSVGGLFFLRFICPCFVTPERFNICKSEDMDKATRRNCILVSKVLQNLSNNVRFALKEPFMVPLNEFLDQCAPKMNQLLIRMSDKRYPEEPLTSLLQDNDLFTIHETLVKNQEAIEKLLQESGCLSLREQFVSVMKDLGAPIPPQVQITDSAQQATKKRLSVRMLRRRSTQISNVVAVNPAAQKFYVSVANQLIQPNYQLAESIWTTASSKEAEILCKSFVRLFNECGCASDCAKKLIRQEVTNCSKLLLSSL